MLKPLNRRLNNSVLAIVDILMPQGYQVTDDEKEVDTFKKIWWRHHYTGLIRVWSGASDKTIFGDPKVNHAFRAWHDHTHIVNKLSFKPEHEVAVCEIQKKQLRAYLRNGRGLYAEELVDLIDIEICGQLAYYQLTGNFVKDQRDFAIKMMQEKGYTQYGQRP